MSDDEIKPTDDESNAIELSDEQLEDVSGGFNLRLNAVFFRQTTVVQNHGGRGGKHPAKGSSASSSSAAETIESAGLQILLTDATSEDLEALGHLLGGATAIDGD